MFQTLEEVIMLCRESGGEVRHVTPLFTDHPSEEGRDILYGITVTWYDSTRTHFHRTDSGWESS